MKKISIFILGAFILFLNVVWEFSHFRLYVDLTGIPKIQHLLIASFAFAALSRLSKITIVNTKYLLEAVFNLNPVSPDSSIKMSIASGISPPLKQCSFHLE